MTRPASDRCARPGCGRHVNDEEHIDTIPGGHAFKSPPVTSTKETGVPDLHMISDVDGSCLGCRAQLGDGKACRMCLSYAAGRAKAFEECWQALHDQASEGGNGQRALRKAAVTIAARAKETP